MILKRRSTAPNVILNTQLQTHPHPSSMGVWMIAWIIILGFYIITTIEKRRGDRRVFKLNFHQTWKGPQTRFTAPLEVDCTEIQALKRVVQEIETAYTSSLVWNSTRHWKIEERSLPLSIKAIRVSIMIYIFVYFRRLCWLCEHDSLNFSWVFGFEKMYDELVIGYQGLLIYVGSFVVHSCCVECL